VAYCKSGTGNIRVNGRPLDMVEPRVLQYKIQEPILLLGKVSILNLIQGFYIDTIESCKFKNYFFRIVLMKLI